MQVIARWLDISRLIHRFDRSAGRRTSVGRTPVLRQCFVRFPYKMVGKVYSARRNLLKMYEESLSALCPSGADSSKSGSGLMASGCYCPLSDSRFGVAVFASLRTPFSSSQGIGTFKSWVNPSSPVVNESSVNVDDGPNSPADASRPTDTWLAPQGKSSPLKL